MEWPLDYRASWKKGELQLNGVKRKVNTRQIKLYVCRKHQLSECDSEVKHAQGNAPVKLHRRPELSATSNNGMDDNNLEDGNLEITGFVKHAEPVDYKLSGSRKKIKQKRQHGNVHFQQPRAVTIDHNPPKTTCMRCDAMATVSSELSVISSLVITKSTEMFVRLWNNTSIKATWKRFTRGPHMWKYLTVTVRSYIARYPVLGTVQSAPTKVKY